MTLRSWDFETREGEKAFSWAVVTRGIIGRKQAGRPEGPPPPAGAGLAFAAAVFEADPQRNLARRSLLVDEGDLLDDRVAGAVDGIGGGIFPGIGERFDDQVLRAELGRRDAPDRRELLLTHLAP